MTLDRPMLSIPNQAEWDDVQLLWHRRVLSTRYPAIVAEAFERLHEEGAASGRFFGLHVHPWLSGMPHRVVYFERALEQPDGVRRRMVDDRRGGDAAPDAIGSRMSGDLHFLAAAEAGRLIQARKLSPVELVDAFLRRIETVDGTVHSYVTVLADQATAEARAAEAEIMAGAGAVRCTDCHTA